MGQGRQKFVLLAVGLAEFVGQGRQKLVLAAVRITEFFLGFLAFGYVYGQPS